MAAMRSPASLQSFLLACLFLALPVQAVARPELVQFSLTTISSAEIARDGDVSVSFSVLPDTTVVQCLISTRFGMDTLEPALLRQIRAALEQSIRRTVAELIRARIPPGELLRRFLLKRVPDHFRRCRIGGLHFNLAADRLQCQLQTQHVPGTHRGWNSSRARGSDLYVFLTLIYREL